MLPSIRSFRTIAVAAALCLLSLVPAFGYSRYDYSVTSTISSLTITGATHSFGDAHLAVSVKKADGTLADYPGDYSYSINASSYDVSLNFSPSLTNGAHVYLYGVYSGSNTTASTDFAASFGASTITVCASCSSGAIAQRAKNSTVYVMGSSYAFTWDTAPSGGSSNVLVYLYDNQLVFAGSTGFYPLAHCSSIYCRVDGNVAAYPAGSIPISTATWNGSGWSNWTDDRPIQFQ